MRRYTERFDKGVAATCAMFLQYMRGEFECCAVVCCVVLCLCHTVLHWAQAV